MGAREDFLDRFEGLWPGWRDDMEGYISHAERTGDSVSLPRHYNIIPLEIGVFAEIYNGGRVMGRFYWPLNNLPEGDIHG